MATKYIINNEDGLITTGQTINGGISATTISATTYQGLPIDPDTYVTAFTYSSNTLTINDNSGSTFNTTINDFTGLTINGDLTVTGNTSVQGLTATTISADTIYVSGNPISKSYKVYTALLTQTGNTAPEAIVLENTLGVVTFEYGSPGLYVLNATGLLTLGKTWVTFNYINSNGQTVSYNGKGLNAFIILSRNSVGVSSNDILDGTEIEIRVYN